MTRRAAGLGGRGYARGGALTGPETAGVSVGLSSIAVSSAVIPDDNTTTTTVTVTALDSHGLPIVGVTPVVTATGSGNTLGAVSATDASGEATCTFKSSAAGSKVISASVSGRTITATVTVTVNASGGAPDLASVDEAGTVAGDTRHFYGSGLTGTTTIKNDSSGGAAWTSVTVVTDGEVTAVAPADTAGAHDIYLVNGAGNTTLAAAVVYAVFADGFEVGETVGSAPVANDQGGYHWHIGGATGDSAYDSVSTTQKHAGSNSVKLHMVGGASGTDSDAQLAFQFGADLSEFWMEYQFYVPANYTHRNDSPGNNKFLVFWHDHYGSLNGDMMVDMEMWFKTSPAGDTYLLPKCTNHAWDGGLIADMTGFAVNEGATFISDAGTYGLWRGQWNGVRCHLKSATSNSSNDGVWELWIDHGAGYDLVLQKVDGDFWFPAKTSQAYNSAAPFVDNPLYTDPATTWHRGYILGWANSGFTDDTDFFVDDVRFYAADPGW